VRDDRAAAREVQADPPRDGRQRITRGVAVGEAVVLAPPAELADGGKVAVQQN
jgi:hypothetical protein